ncbi:hypothetical protein [Actinoplanes sp. NPDC023714]|uniref:hypothetical protein n=1 Tax=Actinoplanes sp. NPDC023714 TaxID=3154322 RepID=UPI0033E0DB3D
MSRCEVGPGLVDITGAGSFHTDPVVLLETSIAPIRLGEVGGLPPGTGFGEQAVEAALELGCEITVGPPGHGVIMPCGRAQPPPRCHLRAAEDRRLSAAGWLRDQLGFEVSSSSEVLRSAGSDASEGWRGSAGVAFGGRMARAAELAGALHGEISSTAGAFDAYADRLAGAQGRMAAAREMAAAGGLPVRGTVIAEPVDPSAPEYARQVAVYEVAAGEAAGARAEMVEAVRGMRTRQAAAQGVPVVRSVDVVRGGGSLGAAAGGMAAGIAGSGDGSGGSVGGAAAGMAGGLSSAGGDATIRPNGEASGVITPAEGGAAEEAEGTISEKPGSINDHSGAAGEVNKSAEAGDAGSREEADGSVSERNGTVKER